MRSGVPQGSVLGPLLFLIMIGDIDAELHHSNATSFADDTRIKKKVETEDDVILLQADLNRILNWAQENNMEMNENKFELMRYGSLQNIKQNTSYQTHQKIINSNEFVRDLGINMSEDATFTRHINSITQTARKLSGWILRTFQTRTKSCMLTLWKALVLPRIEYYCQLCSPHRRGDKIKLEAVQRSFTSRISSV